MFDCEVKDGCKNAVCSGQEKIHNTVYTRCVNVVIYVIIYVERALYDDSRRKICCYDDVTHTHNLTPSLFHLEWA